MAMFSPISFVKEAREELLKVTWPSRETTIRYTIVVIVGSISIGLIAGAMDLVLTRLLEYLITL